MISLVGRKKRLKEYGPTEFLLEGKVPPDLWEIRMHSSLPQFLVNLQETAEELSQRKSKADLSKAIIEVLRRALRNSTGEDMERSKD